MTPKLVPATRRDARPIARILRDWSEETDWMPSSHDARRHRADARLLMDRTEVTVARNCRDVVGFIALLDGAVQSLYLAPSARGQGIGQHFLDMAKARADRLELWTYQANTAARRFYTRHGFYENRLTNGEANDDKLPDVHMVWSRGI